MASSKGRRNAEFIALGVPPDGESKPEKRASKWVRSGGKSDSEYYRRKDASNLFLRRTSLLVPYVIEHRIPGAFGQIRVDFVDYEGGINARSNLGGQAALDLAYKNLTSGSEPIKIRLVGYTPEDSFEKDVSGVLDDESAELLTAEMSSVAEATSLEPREITEIQLASGISHRGYKNLDLALKLK